MDKDSVLSFAAVTLWDPYVIYISGRLRKQGNGSTRSAARVRFLVTTRGVTCLLTTYPFTVTTFARYA